MVISQSGFTSCHCYVDDAQLYVSIKRYCLSTLKNWMSCNFLQFNLDKTDFYNQQGSTDNILQRISKLAPSVKPYTQPYIWPLYKARTPVNNCTVWFLSIKKCSKSQIIINFWFRMYHSRIHVFQSWRLQIFFNLPRAHNPSSSSATQKQKLGC